MAPSVTAGLRRRISLILCCILISVLTPVFTYNRARLPRLQSFGENNTALSQNRDERFLFSLIRFPNDLCGSGTDSGTCFTSVECSQKGGTTIGSCAKGYGVCCKVAVTTCGGDIRVNNTWVQNAEYPSYFNEKRSCQWQVYFDDTPGNICQIRYDFGAHTLTAPSTTGYCNSDKLVFNDDKKSKWFCGVAPSNYHWYVDTPGTSSPHTFTINTDSTSYSRRYAMRVSYIPCSAGVPARCGQYFTGLSGTFNSYNYNQKSYYLAGLTYSICFRKEDGHCTYTLKKTSNNQYIDPVDLLRLMMGEGISAVTAVPAVGNSGLFAGICSTPTTKATMMYYTFPVCFYPDSMTSAQSKAPFFVTVKTELDTNSNVNPFPPLAANMYSGFEFDWTHNAC